MRLKFLMFLLLTSTCLVSHNLSAWTLNNSSRTGFPISDIKVKIATNDCQNANLTASSLDAIVKDAITEFWNKVPTSNLELESLGINTSVNTSSDDSNAAVNKADANGIIIGCSQNATVFTSNSTLGVGGIGCSAGVCRGVVIMNDKAGTNLATSDRATIVTALAHELGHALGLGHSSIQGSLMYYSLSNKTQKTLHQDDIDGISYLYPNEKKIGGIAGACGSIDLNSQNKNTSFLASLAFGLLLLGSLSKFKKRFL